MISTALIVLDEEYWIRQCLDRVRTYPVDEVIIVDGGSRDATVQIIRDEYPEVVLYERPMPVSFSEQRNFAKSKARGEWILSLDADETLRGADLLPMLIEQSGIIGFSFPTDHVGGGQTDVDPHIRLFANRPDLNWTREVHEYLTWGDQVLVSHPAHMEGQREFLRWCPEVTVVHWAYTAPPEHLRQKAERYKKYNQFGAGIQVNSVEDLLPR